MPWAEQKRISRPRPIRSALVLEPARRAPPCRVERVGGAAGQEVGAGELQGLAEQGADVAPAGGAQAVRGRHDPGQQRAEGAGVGGDGLGRQAEDAGDGAHRRAQVGEVAAAGVLGAGEGGEHAGERGRQRRRVEEGSRAGVRDGKMSAMSCLVMTGDDRCTGSLLLGQQMRRCRMSK